MDFEYRAVNSKGEVTTGTGHAPSRIDLIQQLKKQGLTILDIKTGDEEPIPDNDTGRVHFNFEIGVSGKRILFFTRQLASTLKAGLPILRCFSLLKEQTASKNLKDIIDEIVADIQNGQSIHKAMSKHNPPFDDIYLSMVKVGETSGNLPEVINQLADNLEHQMELKRKIKSAMSYPIFILIFSSVMVFLMMTHLLPAFIPIFKGSGLNIARDYPVTQFLINTSAFISHKWVIPLFIGIIILIYFGYKAAVNHPKSRLLLDKTKFYFPFLQGFIQMQYFAQFCDSMASLTNSGVNLLESLRLVAGSMSNRYLGNEVRNVVENVEKGLKLTTSMGKSKVFPSMMVQMLSIGEETGTLGDTFIRVHKYYEQELDSSLESLTSLVEPAMMVLVGFVVFVVIIGIILPIFGITQAVQKQIN